MKRNLSFVSTPLGLCAPCGKPLRSPRVIYCADTCPHAFRHPSLQMGGDKVKQMPSVTQQSQAQSRQCNLFSHAPFLEDVEKK